MNREKVVIKQHLTPLSLFFAKLYQPLLKIYPEGLPAIRNIIMDDKPNWTSSHTFLPDSLVLISNSVEDKDDRSPSVWLMAEMKVQQVISSAYDEKDIVRVEAEITVFLKQV